MKFHIITIFPDIFNSYFNESILKRAQAKKIIKIKTHDLRRWAKKDKHKTVDDKPYGGGAGMVLMAEPVIKALQALKFQIPNSKFQKDSKSQKLNSKIILLSAKGKKWNQAMAKKYANPEHSGDNIILICGRYEGVDERVKKLVDDEVSIGDYVLTGGEIPAMIIVDSITRLLPNALGNADSAKNESHSIKNTLEHPHYTRPEVLKINNPSHKGGASKKYKVPKVLLSGNHAKIEEWRNKKSKKI